MSIVRVEEDYLGQGGDNSLDSLTVKRQFQVETDDFEDRAYQVMTADGVPQPGEEYPGNPDLVVHSVVPRLRTNDPTQWEVEVSYDRKPPTAAGASGSDKPWDLEPQIAFGFVSRQKVLEFAYSLDGPIPGGATRGVPDIAVTNSLEMPFDPPAMIEEYLLTITVARNIIGGAFDASNVGKYQYTINNNGGAPGVAATFKIAGVGIYAYQALCKDYRASSAYTPKNELYWEERITVVVDRDGSWLKRLVDQGFFTARLGTSSAVGSSAALLEYTPIKDTDNKRVLEPVLLDGNRQRLPAKALPVYRNYHAIWEEDWAGWLPTEPA